MRFRGEKKEVTHPTQGQAGIKRTSTRYKVSRRSQGPSCPKPHERDESARAAVELLITHKDFALSDLNAVNALKKKKVKKKNASLIIHGVWSKDGGVMSASVLCCGDPCIMK